MYRFPVMPLQCNKVQGHTQASAGSSSWDKSLDREHHGRWAFRLPSPVGLSRWLAEPHSRRNPRVCVQVRRMRAQEHDMHCTVEQGSGGGEGARKGDPCYSEGAREEDSADGQSQGAIPCLCSSRERADKASRDRGRTQSKSQSEEQAFRTEKPAHRDTSEYDLGRTPRAGSLCEHTRIIKRKIACPCWRQSTPQTWTESMPRG